MVWASAEKIVLQELLLLGKWGRTDLTGSNFWFRRGTPRTSETHMISTDFDLILTNLIGLSADFHRMARNLVKKIP